MKFYLGFLLISLLLLSSCASVKPLKDPPVKGGVQYGVASWYGDKFHGRPTASGIIYDMYAISAAHKTLPLGTVVSIKNMKNGKEVELVINDRGPFVDGRIVDLSFGAAKKIDMVEDGLAPVRLKIIRRETSYINRVKVTASKGISVIQAGSFKDPFNAERLKTILGWEYDNVYIEEVKPLTETTYYRVRIGPYADHTEAVKHAERLAENGYRVWVTGK